MLTYGMLVVSNPLMGGNVCRTLLSTYHKFKSGSQVLVQNEGGFWRVR